MKMIKHLVIGAVIGLFIGLWFGVNIGTGKPLYANPFAERSISKEIMKSSGDILEKSGKAIKGELEEQ